MVGSGALHGKGGLTGVGIGMMIMMIMMDGSGIAKIGQRAVGTLIQQQQLQQQQMQEPSWHVARRTQGLELFKIQEKLVFRNASFL